MPERHIGVLGATSLVGAPLLAKLCKEGWRVTAFSRRAVSEKDDGVDWRPLPGIGRTDDLPLWICIAPIWVLPEHFALLEASGVRRVVALSSTSVFSKADSADPAEQALARRLAEAEASVANWAEDRGVEWVVLRPTLIYGFGRDKNIAEIAGFIRRFGFFPLFGRANGLRQPIHASNVASACMAALVSESVKNRAYNLSGGETLTYRNMVTQVFQALGRPARFMSVPMWVFRVAVAWMRLVPRYRRWTPAMAERMNRDLVFAHADAVRDFGFSPGVFRLSPEDVA